MKSIVLNSENFDSTLSSAEVPVLADFHASSCGPCKMLCPIIDQVVESFDGEATIAKVDIDEACDIAQRYRITSVPSLAAFRDREPVVGARGVQTGTAIGSLIRDASKEADSAIPVP